MLLIVIFCASTSWSQTVSNYSFATGATGSLTADKDGNPIDMSVGTTQLIAPSTNSAASVSTLIGFDFYLMGVSHSTFNVSSHGLLGLSTAIGTGNNISGGTGPRIGAIVGGTSGTSMATHATGQVHSKVFGTAPNRVLVVEWQNMSLTSASTTADATFQVRLYETSGIIEFVYGEINVGSGSISTVKAGFSTTSSIHYTIAYATHTASTTLNTSQTLATGPQATLTSVADGSRRYYRFTPPVPADPTGLVVTPGYSSTVLTWADNATNEVGYDIYQSTDNITFTKVATTAASATTATITGLTPNTLYYWKVVAFSEGAVSAEITGNGTTLAACSFPAGTITVPGSYPTITAAADQIRLLGLNGPVLIELQAGYTGAGETYPIVLGSFPCAGAANSVTIRPAAGATGLSITSASATGTLSIDNGSYITIDGRPGGVGTTKDMTIANTSTSGYALQFVNDASNNLVHYAVIRGVATGTTNGVVVFRSTTGSTGNDNNTIDNSDVRDGATTPANAIYASGSSTNTNDNNTISNSNIFNFFSAGSASNGILLSTGSNGWTISGNHFYQTAARTSTASNQHTAINISNTSGNGHLVSANNIGGSSPSTLGAAWTLSNTTFTNRFVGIAVSTGSTTATNVTGNFIRNILTNTNSSASTANGNFSAIWGSSGAVNITNNTIGSQTATSITVNLATNSGGAANLIAYSGSGAVTISNNIIGGVSATSATTTVGESINAIYVSGGTPTITDNTIGGTVINSITSSVVVTGTTVQAVTGINVTSGVSAIMSITGNTIRNLRQAGTTTSTSAGVRGIVYAGTGKVTITGNTISVLSGATGNTSTTSGVAGVIGIWHSGSGLNGGTIGTNTIFTLSNTNTGAVQSNVAGIGIGNVSGLMVDRNRIYDLRNASTGTTATTPPTAIGIMYRTGGLTGPVISNNMISLGDAQTTNTEFVGIMNNGTTNGFSVYHNTVVISGTATSGALPSFAFLRGDNSGTAVTTPVDIKNNIFVNTRSGGTGKHYAIANQSTAVNAAGFVSNFNVLNAANPATVGLWGNADMTFAAWKSTTGQDAQSVSGIPVSFTNVATGDLHITIAGATPIESGGIGGLGIGIDYDAEIRAGNPGYAGTGIAPDLGADEFAGTQASPSVSNLVITPATVQCAATARTVDVTVTAGTSAIATVILYYSYDGVAQTPVTMTNSAGSTWTGTLPAATPPNALVSYYVTATDANGYSTTVVGSSYQDAPLLGSTITSSATPTTICVGGSSNLSANVTNIATVTAGNGATTSSSAGSSPFYHGWGGQKVQYIFTQGELAALGLTAGPITNLSLEISTLGTATLNGFSISMTNTAQSSFASANAITPVTQVYAGPGANNAQTLVLGVNTFALNTAFNWDGTSNVVVQFCYSNENTGGTSSSVRIDAQPFTSTMYVYADNQTVATICGALTTIPASGSSGTNSNRPKMMFTGNMAPAVTYSWSDGTSTVGTGANLTVSPTTTTTYTVTASETNGCAISAAPVTITVLSVPAAPTGTNSVQCGVAVPGASVSGTGTMMWYDAATGGTLLQTGGNTYTSSISSTTTFYVAASNGTCEGPRTAVTALVTTPDAVVASRNTNNICPNASVQLTATNTGTNNTYTYSWTASPVAGSGIPTSLPGSPVTVTPTAAGTYTYTVTGSETSSGCATTADITVTVIAPPVINTPTASLDTICAGASTVLTATTTSIGAGTVTLGTGTLTNLASSTTSLGYPAPFGNYYWGAKNQMMFTAAELTAAGLMAGDITSIAFDVVTPSTTTLDNFEIGIKTTANSSLTAMESGFTVVYTDPAYTPSSTPGYAANTIVFSTPFAWDGTSNIVIQTCFNNPNFTTSAVFNQSTTSYVSTRVYRADNATVCPSLSTSFSYSQRPNMRLGGITNLQNAGSLTWQWNPGALSGNSVTVSPTTTTTYTVTATDPVTGCSNTATKDIVVTPVTATATSNAGGTVCQGTSVQLTAVPAGGAPFTYSWSDGTSVVGTTETVTVSPTATTLYTVTVTDACSNTTTANVTVTVNNPAVTSTTPGTRCGIGTVTLQATGEPGATLNWYAAATGGTPLGTGTSYTTPSIDATTTYYVGASNGGNNQNLGRLAPVSGSGTSLTTYGQDFTINAATTLNSVDVISTTGTSITISLYSANGAAQLQTTGPNAVVAGSTSTINLGWALAPGTYRLVANGMTGDFIRENSSVTYPITLAGVGQINGFVSSITGTVSTSSSYYFMYNWNMFAPCEGTRVAVTATVTTPPDFNISGATTVCLGQSTTLTATSANAGYTYSWSPGGATGSSNLVTPTATTEYFVTATDASGGPDNGCVTIDSITVVVNPLPSLPAITAATNPICNGQSTQLEANSQYGIGTIRITELTAFRTGAGQTSPYPSNVGTGDDLVEISNLSGQSVNLTGMVLEMWTGTTMNRTWTVPSGTTLPANGVMVVHLGSGTDNAGNLFFNTGGSNSLSSSTAAGLLIKYDGAIIDVVAANSYNWPAASGVTATDWSGNVPSSSGFAGISRTDPTDNNLASDWTVSSAAAPQTVGSYDPSLAPIAPTALNYAWTPATGLSSTTISNPVASPTATTTYTLVVTEPVTGCSNTSNITITVNQLPAITTQPRDTIFCAGGNATFTVAATGDGITYQWKKNGVDIPGATAATYLVNNATPADSGSYTVVVTGTCAPAVTSNAAVLALYGQPTITADPTAQTSCVGSAATFTVTATGEAITYQWRKDGIDITGATSATYTIPSVVMGDAGNYDVIVSGTCSPAVTSAAVALTVNPAPSITGEPTSVSTCEGTSASFTVTATGPGLAYQWRKNGVNITGANASTYSIPAVAASDDGSYDVIVSGTCTPSDTSNAATLTVQILPVITTQPQTQTVCAGQNATFTVVASGTGLSYQWKKDGTDIPGATSASFTITSAVAADAGSYTVVVSGTCAPSVTSNAAVLTVDQAPVIGTQPSSQTVCSGSNVTFTVSATGVGLTYQWYRNGTIAITGATSDTYTITGVTAGSAGQYHVVVNSSCGTTVTSSVATLTVNTPPAITVQPASQTACLASTVNFTVTATGTALTYQWQKNGVDIAGATSSTLSISNVSAADLGSYTVVVSGICGTPVTSSAATLAVSATNTWLGVANSDWNNAANWCAGVPTSTSVILIPSGTPFTATLLANGSVQDLTVGAGATLTIGAGGALNVYGNVVNNGTVTATAGALVFRGTTPQSIPALTAGHVVMNGTGGVILGGTLTINNSLTLTNGHITLGNNNLVMTGGSMGTVASHIITNGTGVVTGNNVGTASVVFPVGPDAASYNPVMIANGGGRNYSVRVATGINPAIFNAARAINRTWNITVNTAPAAPASVTFGYADAHANASATPSANMEVGRHNGTAWLVITPAGGVAPFGTAALRTVTAQTAAFSPFVVSNTGGILNPTSLPNIDADITSAVLMPNVFEHSTLLRMNVRRTMKIDWTIVDARGRVVMTFSRNVLAGQSDIQLLLGHLANGTYFLSGETEKGKTEILRFIKL